MKLISRPNQSKQAPKRFVGFTGVVALTFIYSATCFAAPPKGLQSGSIEIESTQKAKVTFAQVQDNGIKFLQNTLERAKALGHGLSAPAPLPLGEEEYRYLAACYLYCSINLGTCPSFLEALLEADTMIARQAHAPSCPHLTKFWQEWLKSDMERRLQFKVKTGFLNTTTEFRAKVRPRFIKCQGTVTEEIASASSDAEFFKSRYSDESPAIASIQKAVEYAEQIKTREVSVLSTIGIVAK